MGKIKVRKKLRKNKKNNLLSIYVLIGLSILFVFLMFISSMVKDDSVFKVESRTESFKKERKKDTEQFKTVSWLRVQGTNIDYPIINVIDENYRFPINEKSYGWSSFDGDKITKKIDISGHNILNLSSNPVMKDEMFIYFEELMNFVYYDFAKENQFIQLHIDGEEYIYKIFSINFLKSYDVNNFARNGYGKAETKEFLDILNKGNLYEHDVDVNTDDKFISVYTCTRFFGTDVSAIFTVTGRLLREDEKVELSTIKKTEKYNEILEIMKGGEEDE